MFDISVFRICHVISFLPPRFNNGFPVVVTKNKIRGAGKALRIRFESESGKDFDFLGWAIAFSGNTDV